MCGADNWELVEVFGKNQLDWLKSRGNFSDGIPSSDTLGRVFAFDLVSLRVNGGNAYVPVKYVFMLNIYIG
jgi:hypothetical protein